jgi:hypothetical protein
LRRQIDPVFPRGFPHGAQPSHLLPPNDKAGAADVLARLLINRQIRKVEDFSLKR